MKKIISLIKVSLNHDMNIFKINSKKQGKFSKFILPLILTIYMMFISAVYAGMLMEKLKPLHLEYVVLTLFALSISIFTFVEGIYKSGALLFNTKDDNLLFSLPIKKNTIFFIRVFKFYIFELMFNSLFLAPAMFIYAVNVLPSFSYYLISLIALLVLPIVPIALSCIVGFIITFVASKFKGKNIFQTIFTTIFLLFILYLSFNINGFIADIAQKASSISNLITKLYYPVGAYVSLVNNFNIVTLFTYIIINIFILALILFILGKLYFKINSHSKKILISNRNTNYTIKTNSKMKSFVKKELNRFFTTSVFFVNAGFGLILFMIICIMVSLRFDSILESFASLSPEFDINTIRSNIPLFMFGLIVFTSSMTSITSSMISLEGKAITLLKSLPIKPLEIVLYKVITALIIMIPCIILGDIIVFIKFKFDFISILLILLASTILPLVSELIGIIVNLKYPKVDATNDTEVVKQSLSSMISVFTGMGLIAATVVLLFTFLDKGISPSIILLILIAFYMIICLILWVILKKVCDRYFNEINI